MTCEKCGVGGVVAEIRGVVYCSKCAIRAMDEKKITLYELLFAAVEVN